MARLVGIDIKTFKQAFEREIRIGRPKAQLILVNNVFKMARTDLGAAKYWLSVLGSKRWRKQRGDDAKSTLDGPSARPVVIQRASDDESEPEWKTEVPGDGSNRPGPSDAPPDEDAGEIPPEPETVPASCAGEWAAARHGRELRPSSTQ
jgi:hypothetical protein